MRVCCIFGLLAVAVPLAAGDDFKPEPGFVPLFNGNDFTGWKTKAGEPLDGKSEAYNSRFRIADGVLTIDPKVKGDVTINTAKTFAGDVHIKFDFLPGEGCNNDLFLRGLKFDLKKPDVKNLKEGEWNSFEIVLAGDKAEFKCNGETVRTATVKGKDSPFGIRAEFGPMQMRRLRVKE
jgi:3-keto-disaccharide hydrolase